MSLNNYSLSAKSLKSLGFIILTVREALSLADAGLSNGSCLVMENGRPPQDSEVSSNLQLIKILQPKYPLHRFSEL